MMVFAGSAAIRKLTMMFKYCPKRSRSPRYSRMDKSLAGRNVLLQLTSVTSKPGSSHHRHPCLFAHERDDKETPQQHHSTTSSASQQAWLRLFQTPSALRHYRNTAHEARSTLLDRVHNKDLPPIGGDYKFVELRSRPANIYHIDNSLFSTARPYPVKKTLTLGAFCDFKCICVAANCDARTSGCINAVTRTVCDDTICSVGTDCGKRSRPRIRVGNGIVCNEVIPSGVFIIQYVGEVLVEEDAVQRLETCY
ncbi:hypothetical protein PF005_g4998 [Phytophthora fragariae]|uniref:AWS domain-containing protein n=1 Tax=Phytophthora fragariae TaxID=53985 RepID=A0A6A3M9G6_9STRA|nr:hypothetical protein PF003_g4724 [Phytophthora fragariae]KAE8948377.1 hypothetical protein PF009_g2047 [Phytophthora fragariae]KAE9028941.1 hypothetical protein PF011_g1329 [Phytophthora fragariae]KAE9136895.1 hypothetical protein PF010_g1526 [Phytophthora fragariae]KAE9136925.1 hypothetical protein PF007_g1992 [Phytophthora fragariae]